MPRWSEFADAAPDFAARVAGLFTAYRHHTMATLRRDGSPRISGTEVEFEAGDLRLGMMAGTRRAGDLRRDPRIAIHSHNVEPPEQEGELWAGEAKLSGRAIPLAGSDDVDRFWVDIDEVILTQWGTPADHLLIERWRPGEGVTPFKRF